MVVIRRKSWLRKRKSAIDILSVLVLRELRKRVK